MNPIKAYKNLQQFRAHALDFFVQQGLYPSGRASIDFGLRESLVVGEPVLATAVLLSEDFDKGREAYGPLGTFAGFGSLRWLIGPTLPVLDQGEGLARRRKLVPVYARIVERFQALPGHIQFPPMESGEREIYPIVSQVIFERFCAVMFGQSWAHQGQRVSQAVSQATSTLDLLSKSFQPYAGHWGSAGRSIQSCRAVLLDFATEIYADLMESGRDAAIRPLLDCGLSKEEVLDEILTQIVAGTETTTITSCWALSLLARHPDALSRLRDGRLDVDLCVNETLRMYPAFWTMIRVAKRDVLLEGQQINKDTVLFVSPFCVHHNPAFWPNPERFEPERFIERQGVRGDFMPYGYGARACLGGRLAHALIRECVQQAAEQLDLALCADEPQGQQVDPLIVVLKSQTGFRFKVASRGGGGAGPSQGEASA